MNASLVERLWACMSEKRWDDIRPLLHSDFVAEWPQSRVKFVGAEKFIEMNRAYPGTGQLSLKRVTDTGNVVFAEVLIDWVFEPGKRDECLHAIGRYEIRDGKIQSATEYWAYQYEAPEWQWDWATSASPGTNQKPLEQ